MNSTSNDGEKMERQMWEDIKAKNWKAVESKIADGFQSVHPDGASDRANEISLRRSARTSGDLHVCVALGRRSCARLLNAVSARIELQAAR
jgi:hypothetical protein